MNDANSQDMLLADIIELQSSVKLLMERVAVLESGKPSPTLETDPLKDAITSFMSSLPGLKMTALVIAENIGESNNRVGSRLQTLARAGVIESSKDGDRTRMYFWEPKLVP